MEGRGRWHTVRRGHCLMSAWVFPTNVRPRPWMIGARQPRDSKGRRNLSRPTIACNTCTARPMDVIVPPASGLQLQKDEERRGRVDAALHSRVSPAAVTKLAAATTAPDTQGVHASKFLVYSTLYCTTISCGLFSATVCNIDCR